MQLRAIRGLAAEPRLARALVAFALFCLVELSTWLAVILWAYDRGGAGLASMASVVQLVPAAVLAPFLAGIGDRLSRGTALVACHAGVATGVLGTGLALALGAPAAVVVAASGLATIALATVRPVHFAAVPQLATQPGGLVSANALSSVLESSSLFVGPTVAGVAVSLWGAWSVYAGATVAAAASTALCLRLRLPAPERAAAGSRPSRWAEATQGLRVLRGDWPALALLLAMTGGFVLAGALDVLGVAYATSALGLTGSAAGFLIGCRGVGGLAGALVASVTSRRRALAPLVVGCGVGQAVAYCLVGATAGLGPAALAVAGAGLGGTLVLVSGRTLLQRGTDDRVLARVFAVQESASLIGWAVGAAAAPALIGALSTRGAFVPLGVAVALVALAGAGQVRRMDHRAVFRPEEVLLLRGVPFLSVLPPYALEQLARVAEWVEVGPGAVVVRQGEPGSDFYVVAGGTAIVEVGGVPRPAPLVAGDGFGEIALLEAVPRTATVRAQTPLRLLRLGSPDFLAAVTGSPDGHRVAAEVAAAHLHRDVQLAGP